MTPQRIQRERSKGWKKPEGAVYVGRPSKYGNDYCIEKTGKFYAIVNDKTGYIAYRPSRRTAAFHAVEMFEREQLPGMDVTELAGKTIMCWCAVDMPCHGDPILRKANGKETK